MIQSIKEASKRVFSPDTNLRLAALKKINLEDENSINGFTLIELIVVVMIIGILSSIAVPQFLSSADKAKQKESSLLLGSYLKAAQSYYTEYSTVPRNAEGIQNYVSVSKCNNAGGAIACKNLAPIAARTTDTNWYSPSGNYRIRMEGNTTRFRMIAEPWGGTYRANGYGVKSCFNPACSTG